MKVTIGGIETAAIIRADTEELLFDSAHCDMVALHTILSEGGTV